MTALLNTFSQNSSWAGVSAKLSGGELARQRVTAEMAAVRAVACELVLRGALAAAPDNEPFDPFVDEESRCNVELLTSNFPSTPVS
ncbi:MAG TPA: hypothetical protein VHC19_01310 [Pirellulales bacterium]|jgi:hypothetical protein|nr:hypothetical protein [Pirellulales bacterium]